MKLERKWEDALEPVREKSAGMGSPALLTVFLEMTLSGMDGVAPEASGHIKG